MKYVIVSGSHRANSQSDKVARYLQARLGSIDPSSQASILSLGSNPLPLWDEGVWSKTPQWQEVLGPVSAQLQEADAFVFVVPEYGGMVPPGVKNFLLVASNELAHKPALLVAVSAGTGGAYPISEMRMSGYKNTHVAYLPDHLIIRQVGNVLNGETLNTDLQEDKLRERIDYTLRMLRVYGRAFQGIRETNEIDLSAFPYGM